MPDNLIFTDKEVRFLDELAANRVEFMLVGLSAAALQGAPVVTQDVDLWFRDLQDPGIRKALKAVGGTYVPSFGMNPPMLAGDHVRLFDIVLTMHGLGDYDRERRHTFAIRLGRRNIRVLFLDRIIRSKTALSREKDRLVLPVLRDAWKTLRVTERRRVK